MRRITVLLVALLVLLMLAMPLLSGCSKKEATTPTVPPGATIKIGELTDLTGPSATYQVPQHQGLVDYWKYVNDVEGGINGIKVQNLFVDTRLDSQLTLSGYNSLLDQGVVAFCSGTAHQGSILKAALARDKIPSIQSAATPNDLWPVGWVYSAAAGLAGSMGFCIDFVMKNWTDQSRPVRIAFLMQDDTYGHTSALGIPYASSVGAEIIPEA